MQHDFDAVVIGAGLSGLYQVYRLREAGFTVQGIESAPDVGGTWYWNCYPGARVDSPSMVYQYWFSDELLAEWNWSERYSPQPELMRYFAHVADRFDLRRNFRFNTRVESAHWDAATRRWTIGTDQGDSFTARYLICCSGILSAPQVPPFEGHEAFSGRIVHTARWPQEGIDYAGKRVGVVGTGATGIQVIQTIAAQVDRLVVFQRTPPFPVAMKNPPHEEADREAWRACFPELRQQLHHTFSGFEWDAIHQPGEWSQLTAQQRRDTMETLWADGSLRFWVGACEEVLTDEAVNAEFAEFVRDKIRARVHDPALAEKLLPRGPFGIARVPLENGYYDAFNRDNVELVDVRATPIERFSANGLIVAGREYPLDLVVLATGFDAGTGALTRIDIRGRDGISLAESWHRDLRSTMGLQVHGFPNMFTVSGPLAPASALCNASTCLQQQVDWVCDCLVALRDSDNSVIEPSAEKEEEWVSHHDELVAATLFSRNNSWYTGANVEGKPRRFLSYPGGVDAYWQQCEDLRVNGYPGFEIS